MKITDKEVLKQLKLVRCNQLEELLENYPEDERNGCSDMQMLANETGYLYEMFKEEATVHSEDLKEAKTILRETRNGKEIPLDLQSLQPKYSKWKIDNCKDIVNEYRRLGNLASRLAKKGY